MKWLRVSAWETLLDVRGAGGEAQLDVSLVREDGRTPYARRFEKRLPSTRGPSSSSSESAAATAPPVAR